MKITGLITEYNPFHNGHLYHLEASKKETGADYLIALMSGSFVQRGAPAVYDKYVRTAMALQAGADLVLEMPAAFSTASAREFSAFAIALFTALGAVDCVSFGSECADMAALMKIAGLLSEEPEEFSLQLKAGMCRGLTWPESRAQALSSFLSPEEQSLLLSPNNILGCEYCRAAIRQKSRLKMHTIKRRGSGYHETLPESPLPSATAIRGLLMDNQNGDKTASLLSGRIPSYTEDAIRREIPVFPDDFSELLHYRILLALEEKAGPDLSAIADMTPELAARIRKGAFSSASFEERIQAVKSRQLTYTRVSRALLHLLLNMREEDITRYKDAGYAPYARILGFRKSASPLLSRLKEETAIPLLSKLADSGRLLGEPGLSMLRQEISASHIYQSVKTKKGCAFKNEYTQPIVIL